ncbi:hypothetical protein [Bosea sp. PAMC 26642]|uniref:hypothetical protein n=1 Tax=Bosea sp. (strain PAMC 26642) TaxID=1792307 RepID=UPI0012E945DF|nr:hypothetical protein [Bosea sp. PAMC 26642]
MLIIDEVPPAPATDDVPPDDIDPRTVEKLLLGSLAAFMIMWLAALAWLVWWLLQ